MNREFNFVKHKGFGRMTYKTIYTKVTVENENVLVNIDDHPIIGKPNVKDYSFTLKQVSGVELKTKFDTWYLLFGIVSVVLAIPTLGATLLLAAAFLFLAYRKDIIIHLKDGKDISVQNELKTKDVVEFFEILSPEEESNRLTESTNSSSELSDHEARFCSQCGEKIVNGTNFCPKCGNKL